VPRSATHGELCRVCWDKARDALSRVEDLIVHLRSIEKDAQAIGERVQTTMEKRLVVPDSWLAADGLLEALGVRPIPSTASIDESFRHAADAVNAWGDLESIVSTRDGAKRAAVLVRRMQTALQRWPDSEAQYRHVPYLLCPNCSQRTLWRRAPLEFMDDLVVECAESPLMYSIDEGYDYCEWSLDWETFAATYGPIFAEIMAAEDRAAGRRRARVGALLSMQPRSEGVTDVCVAGEHAACQGVSCTCDCHARTYSLWSPKQSIDRIRQLAVSERRESFA
jgi:hypothetical protein